MRTTGKVLFFRPAGWGFIELPDFTNVFVHLSNVVGNIRLNPGDRVEFEVGPARNDATKKQAINVCILERGTVLEVRP